MYDGSLDSSVKAIKEKGSSLLMLLQTVLENGATE